MFLVVETVKEENLLLNLDKVLNFVELKNGSCRVFLDDGCYFDLNLSFFTLCGLLPIANT